MIETDITTDLMGSIDYLKTKDYLIKNKNFIFEADNFNVVSIYNDLEIGMIKDNEDTHGLNAITFLIKINGINMRIKIYNKYICNIICILLIH